MTSIVSASEDDTIVGLSGRTLKISSFMKQNNASNEYRIGLKSLSDLYPSRIRDIISADEKQKQWDEKNKKALADVYNDIANFDAKNPSKKKSDKGRGG
jgi:tripeptidyl-peptidase II